MKYAVPEYSREDINRAGRLLITNEFFISPSMDWALQVMNNWRAAHNFPLNSFHVTLRSRARKLDPTAITAQRLKRLSSIESKLRREPAMKLSQMQDIGGCRAVLVDTLTAAALADRYQESASKNPNSRAEFIHAKDYIALPKDDGYRSVHLVYRYRSGSSKHACYNGLKIEIQLRSQLQHAWATAVETVSTFTGQGLKAHSGEVKWRRFFALMGSALARREGTAIVPGTPTAAADLRKELRELVSELNVYNMLNAWRIAVRQLPAKGSTQAKAFLLVLDANAQTLQVTGFTDAQLPEAPSLYLETERKKTPGTDAVLVSVESLSALRAAYPNYFVDTRTFLNAVRVAVGAGRATA